jgi:hypothetical protein
MTRQCFCHHAMRESSMTPEELVNHVVRVIKIIIFLLLYLYFSKATVMEFFSLAET